MNLLQKNLRVAEAVSREFDLQSPVNVEKDCSFDSTPKNDCDEFLDQRHPFNTTLPIFKACGVNLYGEQQATIERLKLENASYLKSIAQLETCL